MPFTSFFVEEASELASEREFLMAFSRAYFAKVRRVPSNMFLGLSWRARAMVPKAANSLLLSGLSTCSSPLILKAICCKDWGCAHRRCTGSALLQPFTHRWYTAPEFLLLRRLFNALPQIRPPNAGLRLFTRRSHPMGLERPLALNRRARSVKVTSSAKYFTNRENLCPQQPSHPRRKPPGSRPLR